MEKSSRCTELPDYVVIREYLKSVFINARDPQLS